MNQRSASPSARFRTAARALTGVLWMVFLSAVPGAAAVVGEGGQVTLSGSIDQGVFETVTLQALYTDPVVVAFLQTAGDPQSAVARVRNVTATGFEVFLEQPDSGAHGAAETVSYLVVEAGRYVLSGGLEIEAGATQIATVHREGDAYVPSPVAFSEAFEATPVLLHSLVTHTNGAFMASAVTTVDTAGFSAQLEAGGAGTSTAGETLGWIAITDFGRLDCATDLQVGRGSDGSPDGVDDTAHIVDMTDHRTCVQQVGNADAAVASGNSTTDTDGYWARGGGISGLDLSLFAEEDQVADPERSHGDETFAWVAFKSPVLLSTGAAVVFQFDSIASSTNMEETGFAIDMIPELRFFSPIATSRAVWDWNYVEIDAGIAPSGRIILFSSPLANVAAIELRDAPSAEMAYEIGIDNLWESTALAFMFQLSPFLFVINLDPLSIDQQLFPYDEHGAAVSAAGGLLSTTVDEPGGFVVADTQLTLADASTLAVGDRLRIDGEVLEVSSVDANGVDITVVRGSDGTTAAPHDDLRRVYAVEPRSDWFGSMITATAAAVDAVATTLPVTLGSEFADGDIIRLLDETMVVNCPSAPCGNDLTVTRGVQGTTATAHPKSTPVKRFMPVAEWTLDSLANDVVQRGAGSLDYSLVVDVPRTFLISDLTFALNDAVTAFLTAGHLAVSDDIPVAFDQSIDVDFDTDLLVDRWTYTSRVWFDTEAGYDATVALFNDPVAFDPVALPLLLAGTSIYSDVEIVHFTATCRPDPSWTHQDRQCITTVPTERDLAISLTDGVTSAVPGESLTYTLTASNDGLPHSDVQVTDTFPAGLTCTWTSVASGGATGNSAGSGDLADVLVMPALSSVTYTISCDIDPTATGTLVNTATISSPEDDFDPDNDIATDDDTVLVPVADLSITKTDGVTQAVPRRLAHVHHRGCQQQRTEHTCRRPRNRHLSGGHHLFLDQCGDGGRYRPQHRSGDLADVLTLPLGSTVTYSAVCVIDPAATGILSNTATITSVADTTPGNNTATDNDTVLVQNADLSITKTDGVGEVQAGSTTTYTIVVQNTGPSLATAMVADNFPAVTTCSWTSVATGGATGNGTGSGNLAESLSLPPGSAVTYTAVCAIDGAATGTLSNTATISSTADTTPGNNVATDDSIVLAVPGFAKAFSPSDVGEGMPSTLTFTIDNTANALAVGDLAFTDDLPLGLRVAPVPNASLTCTGGTLVAAPHASSVHYSGGSVDAGATCTLSVDVVGARAGSYLNTSSALTSTVGSSSVATATLVVRHRPRFAKSFLPDQILPGETSVLTFSIDNSAGATAVTDLAFTDPLPAGLVVATPNNAVDGCAGSLDALAGSTSISYSGGTVAAGTECTITLDVLGASGESQTNQSSPLSSSAGFGLGNGPPSFEWAVGVASSVSVSAQSVAVDSSDNVIHVGWLKGTSDFDPGPETGESHRWWFSGRLRRQTG